MRPVLAVASVIVLLAFYLYGLDHLGIYGPDEPRYAAIGQAMAASGDLVTPRLWGQPWFEKPALLYWIIAAGFRAGLSPELAPRVPVALLSVGFLIAFLVLLRRHFGHAAAAYATAILATSGGWLVFSQVGVTDLPLAAMFALAVLLSLDRRSIPLAAIALGFAMLSKQLLPLVLILPVLWFRREHWRDILHPKPILLFLLVAAPWYVACWLRNGPAFFQTLVVEQTLKRFVSPELQHVQPWWFYLPILAGGLFPWTPLLVLTPFRKVYADPRVRMLAVTALWGFLFFSASKNKLPGYLLPLLPLIAAVLGVALDRAKLAGRAALRACALFCGLIPALAPRIPVWLASDPNLVTPPSIPMAAICLVVIAAAAFVRKREWMVASVAVLAIGGYTWTKATAIPRADSEATARDFWHQIAPQRDNVCVERLPLPHRMEYGLNYYAGTSIPACWAVPAKPLHIVYRDHRLMLVAASK